MNKPEKSSIFKATLLVALFGAAFGSQAAGLGKLTVYSAIGQPLNAEVALTATPEEISALSAKLASHTAFSDAGIDFMPALTGLRFSVAKSPGGQPILRLSTDSPLNEPFLHFLVELNWTSGRMVREYTFLLDPPEMLQMGKPARVVPVVPPAQATSLTPVPSKVDGKTTSRSAAPSSGQSVGEYQVKAGDTLSKIARENKAESVSLDQMLVALFNNNREIFDGSNMNRLRAGKILRLPDPTDAAKVNGGEARKLIVSQAADFNAYRRRLADAAGTAPAVEVAPQQQTAGKIKPQVEAKAAPAPTADKLEVSRTEVAKTAKAGGGGKGLEEDLIARDKSLREAAERIAQLEKNLENLKHLVELKSQPGAQVQQQAQAAAASKPVEEKKPEPSAPKTVAAPVASAPVTTVPAAEKPAEPVSPVVAPKPAEAEAGAAKSPDAVSAPVKAPEPPKSPEPSVPSVKKPAPPPPPPPPPEASFVDDNPELVFGGGGLLALLLGYFGFTAWRKKKQASDSAEFGDKPGVSESGLAAKSGAVFGAASESVDNGEVSIQGDFSEGGVLTTEENVDPVAEADVLMAYGRDSQAEEILKEGLKSDPTRGAIHLKLLELYANRKSVQQFEVAAKNLHDLNNGRGPEWDKAVDLARTLGVTGGLFAGTETESTAVAAPESVEPEKVSEPAASPAASQAVVSDVAPLVQEMSPAAEVNAGSLDFDLDLGTTSGPAVAAAAEQAAAKPAADEVMSLDFDFDLGTAEPAVAGATVTTEAAVAEPVADVAAADDGSGVDFSLDLGGETELPAAEPEQVAPEVRDAVVASDIDFDLGLDSDMPAAEEIPAQGRSNTDTLGLADISLDLGEPEEAAVPPVAMTSDAGMDLDLAMDVGGTADAAAHAEPEVKVSAVEQPAAPVDLSVELPEINLPANFSAPVAAPFASPVALPELDLDSTARVAEVTPAMAGSDADDPEVSTKLELAQAYEEMGDRDGARELLNEVLSEGSVAQQATARARLDQLDA